MHSIQLTLVGNFEIRFCNNYAVIRHLFCVLLATLDRSIYNGNMAMLAAQQNFQLSRADENWMTARSFNRIKSLVDRTFH